ncbi:pygopus homolog 2-like isoform X2 [Lampetra fluviatilis]
MPNVMQLRPMMSSSPAHHLTSSGTRGNRGAEADPDGKDLFGPQGSPEKKKRRNNAQAPPPISEFAPPPTPMVDHLVAANPFDDDFIPSKGPMAPSGFMGSRPGFPPPGPYGGYRMPGSVPPRMPYGSPGYRAGPPHHHMGGPQGPPFPPNYMGMGFGQGGGGNFGHPANVGYGPRGAPMFHPGRGGPNFSPPHGPMAGPGAAQNFGGPGPGPAFSQGCPPTSNPNFGPGPGMNFMQSPPQGVNPNSNIGGPNQNLPQGNGQNLNHIANQNFSQGLPGQNMSQSPSPIMSQLMSQGTMRLNNGLGPGQGFGPSPGQNNKHVGPGPNINSQSPSQSSSQQGPIQNMGQNTKGFGQANNINLKSFNQDSNMFGGQIGGDTSSPSSNQPMGGPTVNSNQTNSGPNNGTLDGNANSGGPAPSGASAPTGSVNSRPVGLGGGGPPPSYACGACLQEVSEGQEAIPCEVACQRWFHRECAGLSELAYKLLAREDCAVWACDGCMAGGDGPLHRLTPTQAQTAQPSPANAAGE